MNRNRLSKYKVQKPFMSDTEISTRIIENDGDVSGSPLCFINRPDEVLYRKNLRGLFRRWERKLKVIYYN